MAARDASPPARPRDGRLDALERQNAELQRFASHAAHDLQEPLRLVTGYLDLLLVREGAKGDAEATLLAREARDAAGRMSAMVEGLLEHARAATAPLRLETYPLGESLRDALSDLGPFLRGLDVRLTSDPLPLVRADRHQVTRVLQNLLSNAAKFRVPGEPARIHVGARRAGSSWEILVEDHGLGVPEGAVLFEPFHRHHPDVPGTGLGLSACRAIVERHGGRIWSTPTPGGGATLHFTLEGPP